MLRSRLYTGSSLSLSSSSSLAFPTSSYSLLSLLIAASVMVAVVEPSPRATWYLQPLLTETCTPGGEALPGGDPDGANFPIPVKVVPIPSGIVPGTAGKLMVVGFSPTCPFTISGEGYFDRNCDFAGKMRGDVLVSVDDGLHWTCSGVEDRVRRYHAAYAAVMVKSSTLMPLVSFSSSLRIPQRGLSKNADSNDGAVITSGKTTTTTTTQEQDEEQAPVVVVTHSEATGNPSSTKSNGSSRNIQAKFSTEGFTCTAVCIFGGQQILSPSNVNVVPPVPIKATESVLCSADDAGAKWIDAEPLPFTIVGATASATPDGTVLLIGGIREWTLATTKRLQQQYTNISDSSSNNNNNNVTNYLYSSDLAWNTSIAWEADINPLTCLPERWREVGNDIQSRLGHVASSFGDENRDNEGGENSSSINFNETNDNLVNNRRSSNLNSNLQTYNLVNRTLMWSAASPAVTLPQHTFPVGRELWMSSREYHVVLFGGGFNAPWLLTDNETSTTSASPHTFTIISPNNEYRTPHFRDVFYIPLIPDGAMKEFELSESLMGGGLVKTPVMNQLDQRTADSLASKFWMPTNTSRVVKYMREAQSIAVPLPDVVFPQTTARSSVQSLYVIDRSAIPSGGLSRSESFSVLGPDIDTYLWVYVSGVYVWASPDGGRFWQQSVHDVHESPDFIFSNGNWRLPAPAGVSATAYLSENQAEAKHSINFMVFDVMMSLYYRGFSRGCEACPTKGWFKSIPCVRSVIEGKCQQCTNCELLRGGDVPTPRNIYGGGSSALVESDGRRLIDDVATPFSPSWYTTIPCTATEDTICHVCTTCALDSEPLKSCNVTRDAICDPEIERLGKFPPVKRLPIRVTVDAVYSSFVGIILLFWVADSLWKACISSTNTDTNSRSSSFSASSSVSSRTKVVQNTLLNVNNASAVSSSSSSQPSLAVTGGNDTLPNVLHEKDSAVVSIHTTATEITSSVSDEATLSSSTQETEAVHSSPFKCFVISLWLMRARNVMITSFSSVLGFLSFTTYLFFDLELLYVGLYAFSSTARTGASGTIWEGQYLKSFIFSSILIAGITGLVLMICAIFMNSMWFCGVVRPIISSRRSTADTNTNSSSAAPLGKQKKNVRNDSNNGNGANCSTGGTTHVSWPSSSASSSSVSDNTSTTKSNDNNNHHHHYQNGVSSLCNTPSDYVYVPLLLLHHRMILHFLSSTRQMTGNSAYYYRHQQQQQQQCHTSLNNSSSVFDTTQSPATTTIRQTSSRNVSNHSSFSSLMRLICMSSITPFVASAVMDMGHMCVLLTASEIMGAALSGARPLSVAVAILALVNIIFTLGDAGTFSFRSGSTAKMLNGAGTNGVDGGNTTMTVVSSPLVVPITTSSSSTFGSGVVSYHRHTTHLQNIQQGSQSLPLEKQEVETPDNGIRFQQQQQQQQPHFLEFNGNNQRGSDKNNNAAYDNSDSASSARQSQTSYKDTSTNHDDHESTYHIHDNNNSTNNTRPPNATAAILSRYTGGLPTATQVPEAATTTTITAVAITSTATNHVLDRCRRVEMQLTSPAMTFVNSATINTAIPTTTTISGTTMNNNNNNNNPTASALSSSSSTFSPPATVPLPMTHVH